MAASTAIACDATALRLSRSAVRMACWGSKRSPTRIGICIARRARHGRRKWICGHSRSRFEEHFNCQRRGAEKGAENAEKEPYDQGASVRSRTRPSIESKQIYSRFCCSLRPSALSAPSALAVEVLPPRLVTHLSDEAGRESGLGCSP